MIPPLLMLDRVVATGQEGHPATAESPRLLDFPRNKVLDTDQTMGMLFKIFEKDTASRCVATRTST